MTDARLKEFVQARGTIVWCKPIITEAPTDPVSFESTVFGYVSLEGPSGPTDGPPPFPEDLPEIQNSLGSVCIANYHSTEFIGQSYTLNPQTNGYMPLDNDPSMSDILSRASGATCSLFSTIDGYIGFTTSEVQPDNLLLITQTKRYIVVRPERRILMLRLLEGL
jgi:hypothetical protein